MDWKQFSPHLLHTLVTAFVTHSWRPTFERICIPSISSSLASTTPPPRAPSAGCISLSSSESAPMTKETFNDQQIHIWSPSSYSPVLGSDSQTRASIKQSIAEIEAQIKQLQLKLARQRALLSSNSILPPEILARILADHFCNTPDDFLTQPNRLAPLAVCRFWRQTALSTSSCWTSLDFTARWANPNATWSDMSTFRGIRTRLHRQFSRAGDRPVDLIVRYAEPRFDAFGGKTGMTRNERVAGIAGVLSSFAHRLTSFAEFGISSSSPEDCFFSKTFANVETNILTRLRVRTLGSLLHSFPQLETLYVDGFVTLSALSNLDAPKLTSLHVGGSIQSGNRSPGKFSSILQKFPQLQRVTMICNANLLDADTQHHGIKELRFHESIYQHGYPVPDNIRSLESVCEFLHSFPSVDTLTFSSSIIYIYDDGNPPVLEGADRIRHLNFEGSVEFGWRSTIDAFSAFGQVANIKLDHSKPGSVFEWDKGRGAGNLFLFEMLGEDRTCGPVPARWLSLENLELIGVRVDSKALDHLLGALAWRMRSGCMKECTLTTRQCSFSDESLVRCVPDVKGMRWMEVKKMFERIHGEMNTTQNYLDAMEPLAR